MDRIEGDWFTDYNVNTYERYYSGVVTDEERAQQMNALVQQMKNDPTGHNSFRVPIILAYLMGGRGGCRYNHANIALIKAAGGIEELVKRSLVNSMHLMVAVIALKKMTPLPEYRDLIIGYYVSNLRSNEYPNKEYFDVHCALALADLSISRGGQGEDNLSAIINSGGHFEVAKLMMRVADEQHWNAIGRAIVYLSRDDGALRHFITFFGNIIEAGDQFPNPRYDQKRALYALKVIVHDYENNEKLLKKRKNQNYYRLKESVKWGYRLNVDARYAPSMALSRMRVSMAANRCESHGLC